MVQPTWCVNNFFDQDCPLSAGETSLRNSGLIDAFASVKYHEVFGNLSHSPIWATEAVDSVNKRFEVVLEGFVLREF